MVTKFSLQVRFILKNNFVLKCSISGVCCLLSYFLHFEEKPINVHIIAACIRGVYNTGFAHGSYFKFEN